jgi:plasmid stability protein
MKQLTLRIDDRLVSALKAEAARREESVNALATRVLAAAVDPELAGDEAERLRARLRQAGVLAEDFGPVSVEPGEPEPGGRELEAAREIAARGRSLAEYVGQGRGSH